MKKDELYSKLFNFSIPTYYNWKKESRPIIKLLEKYLTTSDLEEFLEKEKILKLDMLDKFIEEKNKKVELYLKYFSTNGNQLMYMSHNKIPLEYLATLINYNREEDFFIQFNNNVYLNNKIEDEEKKYFTSTLNNMIKSNIINIINEIVDILITNDLKILVKTAIAKGKDETKLNEAIFQCTMFNIHKYKNDLPDQEKYNLFLKITENNKIKESPIKGGSLIFEFDEFEKDLEKLKD